MFTARKIGNNSIAIEEGTHIVVVTFAGEQGVRRLEEMGAAMQADLAYLRSQKQSPLLMLNLTNISRMSGEERKVALRGMSTLDFDKLAIFGGSMRVGMAAKFLIFMSGRSDKVQYFHGEEEARDWLER